MNEKKKLLKFWRKKLREVEEIWLQLYGVGFDDGYDGKPMQSKPDMEDGTEATRCGRLLGKALYEEGYRAGKEVRQRDESV